MLKKSELRILKILWATCLIQGVPKTWEFSDEFDIVFVMN